MVSLKKRKYFCKYKNFNSISYIDVCYTFTHKERNLSISGQGFIYLFFLSRNFYNIFFAILYCTTLKNFK